MKDILINKKIIIEILDANYEVLLQKMNSEEEEYFLGALEACSNMAYIIGIEAEDDEVIEYSQYLSQFAVRRTSEIFYKKKLKKYEDSDD
jgi:hypothetical protein